MKNTLKNVAKKIVPVTARDHIREFIENVYYSKKEKELHSSSKSKRIILLGTPEHGNLGDHAIAEAELMFLSDHLSECQVIEITGEHYRSQKDRIKGCIKSTDIICITGGGFLGTLWMIEERMVRDIISTFNENKIVIFPSTIYFDESDSGKKELKISAEIFSHHENLTICLRDERSIEVAKKLVGEEKMDRLLFTPDIALYLNKMSVSVKRSGILFCMRDDKERVLSKSERDEIIKIAKKSNLNTRFTSTILPKQVKTEERSTELEKKYNEFRSAELVITDRLHGMIFATITGTPCIAMDNSSGKVKGVYHWIHDLSYIKLADSSEEYIPLIEQLIRIKKPNFNNQELRKSYERLISSIKVQGENDGK